MGFKELVATGPLPLPRWLIFTKGVIILFSVVILALAAYAISIHGGYYYYYSSGVAGFLIFLVCVPSPQLRDGTDTVSLTHSLPQAIFTWIVYGGSTALEIWAPQWYFRIAVFVAYILSIIFWLTGWAWSASLASYMLSYISYYGPYKNYGLAMAGCAALGAVVWVLAIVNLVFFCMACFRKGDTERTGNVELGETQKPVPATTRPIPHEPVATQPAPAQQPFPVNSST